MEALRAERGSRVLPLGAIASGAARHRAVLLKALADRTGAFQCSLQMGKCLRGAHAHHAWNEMILEGSEVRSVESLRRELGGWGGLQGGGGGRGPGEARAARLPSTPGP